MASHLSLDDVEIEELEEGEEEEVFTEIDIPELRDKLANQSLPLTERFRALFLLRNLRGSEVSDALIHCFYADPSALLRHEISFVLGQMQERSAISFLKKVLSDESENPMVRHEAGEALGAIADPEYLSLLEYHSKSLAPEVQETCEIALERVKWVLKKTSNNEDISKYNSKSYFSVDPAPPSQKYKSVPILQQRLLNPNLSLFKRYRALFALRELESKEAVIALVSGLDDSSALMRHEIAYVLGQMQNEAAVDGLVKNLKNVDEHPMVRHEAAEALGNIASDRATPVLKEFCKDSERVVRESCYISLDISDYVTSNTFEYVKTN